MATLVICAVAALLVVRHRRAVALALTVGAVTMLLFGAVTAVTLVQTHGHGVQR